MCKVTVLVPVYNTGKYLGRCLESLKKQTLQEIEFICINDGSTDNSLSILQKYAQVDCRFHLIDKENTGYGASMNIGLRYSRGEYIGIVESDDFVDSCMFERLYDDAIRTNADVVKSNYWEYKYGIDELCEALHGCRYEWVHCPREDDATVFSAQFIWSAVYRRDFLVQNHICFNETPGASYQDVSFAFKVFACAEKVFLIKDAFLHYRMDNPDSSVKSVEKAYCIFDEFFNIEIFLARRRDLCAHCSCILAPLKYRLCQWHYYRIAICYKMPFLRRVVREFKATEDAGHVKRMYWKEEDWEKVQEIIHFSNRFLYVVYSRAQHMQMLREGFLRRISNFSSIYFYGAGKIAKQFVEIFKQNEIEIRGCLVSDTKRNVMMLLGVPVMSYDKTNPDKDNTLILIAFKNATKYDILEKLHQDGYENVIPLEEDLKEALKYSW